jgi:murein DD-endopeptidase MepM/ murein hydrolase activator NlpD
MFGNMTTVAFAQELATPSATEATPSMILDQPETTTSATPSAIVDIPVSSPSAAVLTPTPTLEMLTGPSGVLSPSASIKLPPRIRQMIKHTFRAGEVASIIVENVDISTIKATMRDGSGVSIESTPSIETYDGGVRVMVIPKISLKPGKYTIVVEDSATGTTLTQDFLWGVLAFNTDQATYALGDTAAISLAVLDETGMMVCDADVTLTILSPTRQKTVLTTNDGSIQVTSACHFHAFTLEPDYKTTFQTSDEGVYPVTLTAITKNGTYTIQDSFQVSSDVPFQIRRQSATRVFPPEWYPMTIDVTAAEDFTGVVTETVPQNFTVTPMGGALPYSDMQIVAPGTDLQSHMPISLTMPFEGNYPVTLGFGERIKDPLLKSQYEQFGLKGHDGADFAMPEGTQVLAVDSGKVVRIADNPYGTTVVIDHSWGRSYYGHLSVVQVKEGDIVANGAPIALSGMTGLTTGSHLHFGMKFTKNDIENGYYGKIDPMAYLTSSAIYLSDNSVKQITWNVSVKKGEKIQLGYQYKTPPTSPQFYLLGPLTFRTTKEVIPTPSITLDNPFVLGIASESARISEASVSAEASPSAEATASGSILSSTPTPGNSAGAPKDTIVYQEARQWQLAIDAASILVADADITTTNWTATGTCAGGQWDCIEEGTVSPDDTNYLVSKKNATSTHVHTTTNSSTVTSRVSSITFYYRVYKTGVNAATLSVYYSTDGSDPSIAVATGITLGTITTASTAVTGLSLTKTQIDALRVKYVVVDGVNTYGYITATEYDITYVPTTDSQMRHGNFFSGGVEQGFSF